MCQLSRTRLYSAAQTEYAGAGIPGSHGFSGNTIKDENSRLKSSTYFPGFLSGLRRSSQSWSREARKLPATQ